MKIIIDTDPGQDDALTILLALASPEIELLGVTTVAGNVPVAQTTENALKTLDLVGRTDIPVHAGADRPLLRPGVTATHVHGKTGFEGVDLPPPSREATPDHAVDFIIRTVMENPPGTITLCTIGPLTNIALALAKEPAAGAYRPNCHHELRIFRSGEYYPHGGIQYLCGPPCCADGV